VVKSRLSLTVVLSKGRVRSQPKEKGHDQSKGLGVALAGQIGRKEGTPVFLWVGGGGSSENRPKCGVSKSRQRKSPHGLKRKLHPRKGLQKRRHWSLRKAGLSGRYLPMPALLGKRRNEKGKDERRRGPSEYERRRFQSSSPCSKRSTGGEGARQVGNLKLRKKKRSSKGFFFFCF